ncbi:MAG TPA: cytochrome d ubiquinol oxidase subunit II [Spirochaetota bacterium]|nr:cytochrome d ubiquinol oxidase subunit II [Spirochaetota bacterium]
METMEILQIIWFVLIGVLLAGYSVLDGFDLGIGALLPFLSKSEDDTARLFNSIGPVWDGNEVWLLTGGGALFAAFPHVYATVFSGFYLALIILLCALIFRAVSLEFWSLDVSNRKIWKTTFFLGSLVPSLLFGVALGNVIFGIPINASMEFTGNFFTLLRPFPLAIGLLGLAAVLFQGSTYAAVKTTGDLQIRAREFGVKIWMIYLGFLLLAFLATVFLKPAFLKNIGAWIFTLVAYGALIFSRAALRNGEDRKAFLASTASFLGLWGITGSLQFPVLARTVDIQGVDLTIYNASSSHLTLSVMLIIALVGMPFVIAYTAYVYRIFKGKIA